MSVALRVLAIWLALNALLVAVWAWIGWFARRARTEVRRRRAEIAFTTLGMAAILASLSLINPGVRHAVTPIVNSALGLTRAHEDRRLFDVPGGSTAPFGSPGPAHAPSTATAPGSAGGASDQSDPGEKGPRGPRGLSLTGAHAGRLPLRPRVADRLDRTVSRPEPLPVTVTVTDAFPRGLAGAVALTSGSAVRMERRLRPFVACVKLPGHRGRRGGLDPFPGRVPSRSETPACGGCSSRGPARTWEPGDTGSR